MDMPTPTRILDRFNDAVAHRAPAAALAITVGLLAAANQDQALAAEIAEAEGELAQIQVLSEVDLENLRSGALPDDVAERTADNASLPSPDLDAGADAHSAILDLTENTLLWLDESGVATYPPATINDVNAIYRDGRIQVTGSYEARYKDAVGEELDRLQGEPTRVFGAPNERVAAAMVTEVRGAPGDPRGFSREEVQAARAAANYSLEPNLERLRQNRERGATNEQRAAERAERQESRPTEWDRIGDRGKSAPERIAQRTTRNVLNGLERAANRWLDQETRKRMP